MNWHLKESSDSFKYHCASARTVHIEPESFSFGIFRCVHHVVVNQFLTAEALFVCAEDYPVLSFADRMRVQEELRFGIAVVEVEYKQQFPAAERDNLPFRIDP